jgi:hypothetical protein
MSVTTDIPITGVIVNQFLKPIALRLVVILNLG